MPNGMQTQASNIHHLHHNVWQPAKDVHIVPSIATTLLLSTAKFATAGYITVFNGKEVNIYDASNTEVIITRDAIFRGWFDKTANLWRIPLLPLVQSTNTNTVLVKNPPTEFLPNCPPPYKAVHNVYELKTQPKLIWYLHTAAGFPTKPTWIAAIKNKQFTSWPGLTAKAFAKHYPKSKETMKGHGRKGRSGLWSTKLKEPVKTPPPSATKDTHTNHSDVQIATGYDFFIKIICMEEEGNEHIFTDQTGRFPKKSSQGNQFIMVLSHPDSNAILQEAMRNHIPGEMNQAFQVLLNQLKSAGIKSKRHFLDNKCSDKFKATIKKNEMTYQLVLPHNHQQNIAEMAIKVFKAHFISILCSVDMDFPLHLWDRLLPLAEHTLNMLRRARVTPTFSAYTYLWGQHNYNANPFHTTWMQGWSTYYARGTWDVGFPHSKWLLHWERVGTLQMSPSLHQLLKAQARQWNSIFPAQVPHNAYYYSGGCTY
jgi:hypothetical protein